MLSDLRFHIQINDHGVVTEQPTIALDADDCYNQMIHHFHEIDSNLPNGTTVKFEPKKLMITINKPNKEQPIIINGYPTM